jgi:uncharacterized protein (DUF3820 family)
VGNSILFPRKLVLSERLKMKIPFGKYKGQDFCAPPLSYIKWLESQHWITKDIRDMCNYEIARREGDLSSFGRPVQKEIKFKVSSEEE